MAHTEQLESQDSLDVQPVGGLANYTPLQQHALMRYARLDSLRRQVLPRLDSGDWRARLVHKALFSAYLDCQAQGVADEARLFGNRN